MSDNTALTKTTASALNNLFDPQTFDELKELAATVTASGLVPDDV